LWRGYTLYRTRNTAARLTTVELRPPFTIWLPERSVILRFSPLSSRRTSARKSHPRYVILSFRPVPCGIGESVTFSGRPIVRFDRMKIFNNNTPFVCVLVDACSRSIQNRQEGKLGAWPVRAVHCPGPARVAEQQRPEGPTPWAIHHQSQGDRAVRQKGKLPLTKCLSKVLTWGGEERGVLWKKMLSSPFLCFTVFFSFDVLEFFAFSSTRLTVKF